jgi:group I intron endonuclease
MKIFIYTLEDSNGNVRYIGKTKNIKRRYREHIRNYKNSKTYVNNWIKSLIKDGESPVISILDEVDYDDSAFFEIYWISQFKSWGFNLANLTIGGDGISGYKWTDEQRQKMRKPKSKDHIENLRRSLTGRELSDDWKNNIRNGCKNSEKVLQANIRIGKEKEIEVYQYDKFNLLVGKFNSIKEASYKTGIKHISECINGKRRESNGYYWSISILREKEFILKDIKIGINSGDILLDCSKIEDIVCDYFGVTKQEMRKTSTVKNIPKIYLTWMLYNLIDNISFSKIDDYLGSSGSKFRIKYKFDNKTLMEIGHKIYEYNQIRKYVDC